MHAICAPGYLTRGRDFLHMLVVLTQFVDGLNLAIHEPNDPDEQNVSFESLVIFIHHVQDLLCCKLLTGKMHGALFVYTHCNRHTTMDGCQQPSAAIFLSSVPWVKLSTVI